MVLRNMVRRHLSLPHEFVCVTDRTHIADGIRCVPLDNRSHVPGTCGRKLTAWAPDAAERIGRRILALDLDIVIVDSIDDLAGRTEPCLLWKNPNFSIERHRAFFQGSIQLHDAGAHPEVWTEIFRPGAARIVNRRFGGYEQAWLSEILPWSLPHWTAADGLYGAGRLGDVSPDGVGTVLPGNARIVSFPGAREPSQAAVQERFPFVKEHYR